MVGKTFHYLTVVSRHGTDKFRRATWNCICKCGSELVLATGALNSGNTKSCGCYKTEVSTSSNTGSGSPNWKGGITSANTNERNLASTREWRGLVYRRDSFTCQKCNKTGGELNAHHIQPFSDHPHLRVVVSNGVTLCKVCHNNFHNTYGYKGFTPLQFEVFLF